MPLATNVDLWNPIANLNHLHTPGIAAGDCVSTGRYNGILRTLFIRLLFGAGKCAVLTGEDVRLEKSINA